MKKGFKKLGAVLLTVAMALAMNSTVFAANFVDDKGEVGYFYGGVGVDNPTSQGKAINIQKEIKAYNPDESYVYGPEISYTYSIASAEGSELVQITDDTQDHTNGVEAVTTALGAADISSGTPSLTGTTANTIAWTNADILNASSAGASNIKNLTVDFSNVVFTKPGVYRYKITESATYANTGVTDGAISTVRYLDVYVMRSDSYTDGTAANDWDIYGYVCISQESVATNAGGTTNVTTSTKKTNGFVYDGTNSPDQYYTYNFTVTKDVKGDNTMIDHLFPLTVAFENGPTGKFQLIAKTDGAKSSLTTTTVAAGAATVNSTTGITGATATSTAIEKVGGSAALASFANAGTPKVADGDTVEGATTGYIKYIGIPNTVVVTVTEENDVTGTTYTASVKEDTTTDDGSALADVALTSTTGSMAASSASASIDNGETATRTAATGGTANALAKNVDIQFTNTLAIISPTGFVVRFAPYALVLFGGIFLIVLGVVLYKRTNKEEA